MVIPFRCECGKQLQAKDEHAGRRTKCPTCGRDLVIPPKDEASEAVTPAAATPPPRSAPPPAAEEALEEAPARRVRPGRDDDEDEDRPSRRRRVPAREDEDEDDRARARRPVTSGLAVASLVLGLLGVCLPVIGGLGALILGLVAMMSIGRSNGRLKGQGLAVTGMVLGLLTVVGWPVGGYFAFLAGRQGAYRAISVNNLRQMAIAMENYRLIYARYPPAVLHGPTGQEYSWRVAMLPFLEEQALYKQYNQEEPWNSPGNMQVLAMMPNIYAVPGEPPGNATHYQVFTGPGTMFGNPDGAFPNDLTNGASNILMIVEATDAVPWTQPVDLKYVPGQPLPRLGVKSGASFPAAFADGSVRIIGSDTSEQTLRSWIAPVTGSGGRKRSGR